MELTIKSGDITDEEVDVLISSANPWLRMTGGVNGAILHKGGTDVQEELEAILKPTGKFWIKPGSVVRTGPGPLKVRCILHGVAIDGFYRSSIELVVEVLTRAFNMAVSEGAGAVALPALGCGYGHLEISEFGQALRQALKGSFPGISKLLVVLRTEDDVSALKASLEDIQAR